MARNTAASRRPQLTKKDYAKKICFGFVITSVWLTFNGVFLWTMEHMRQKVKLVEDYSDWDYSSSSGGTFDGVVDGVVFNL